MMSVHIESLRFKNMTLNNSSGDKVFSEVNFEFPMNEIIAVQGLRGSGKSALLKLLAGLSTVPDQGEYLINDKSVYDMSFEEFAPYRKQMGYGFDYGGLLSNKTIFQNLMLPLEYHNVPQREAVDRVFHYLNLFHLMEVKDERPAMISGGMRKEACVVRAFMLEPEVLLLDDPTLGMSPSNKQTFLQFILDGKKTEKFRQVIIATDDPEITESLATKLVYLKDHNIMALT